MQADKVQCGSILGLKDYAVPAQDLSDLRAQREAVARRRCRPIASRNWSNGLRFNGATHLPGASAAVDGNSRGRAVSGREPEEQGVTRCC